ncbi:MAG: FMN-binding protein [Pseudomonadota bacterium]
MKATIALLAIAALCITLLYLADDLVGLRIDSNRLAQQLAVFTDMVGSDAQLNPGDVTQPLFGDCSAFLGQQISQPGYGGEVQMAVIITPPANLSLRAMAHEETPGIGDFIDGTWLSARDGQPLSSWQTLDNVSGATVTTKAVQRGIATAINNWELTCAGP